jgi:hypothetical protein
MEQDNLRAALSHAIGAGGVEEATAILFAVWRFWQMRGHLREGRTWATQVLALPGGSAKDRLRALEAAGGISYWLGDEGETRRLYREAYELASASGSAADRAQAGYNYAFTFFVGTVQEKPRGDVMLRESLAAYREIGDRAGIGRAAWALGSLHSQGVGNSPDELRVARDFIREALEQHRTLGNWFDVGWDLRSLGLLDYKLGEQAAGTAHWFEAFEYFITGGDSGGLTILLSDLSAMAKLRGDLDRHATLAGAAVAAGRRTGVGLSDVIGETEQRAAIADIPADHQAALERGLAMNDADAVAYARETGRAWT